MHALVRFFSVVCTHVNPVVAGLLRLNSKQGDRRTLSRHFFFALIHR